MHESPLQAGAPSLPGKGWEEEGAAEDEVICESSMEATTRRASKSMVAAGETEEKRGMQSTGLEGRGGERE